MRDEEEEDIVALLPMSSAERVDTASARSWSTLTLLFPST